MNKIQLMDFLALQIKKHPAVVELLKKTARNVSPETVVILDFPVHSRQRWNQEHPHQELYDIINKNRDVYEYTLQSFLPLLGYFTAIAERQTPHSTSTEPYWINGWVPALDGVALYSFIVINKPKFYLEVGSGNSTKFARKAIVDHNLNTKIISIDPYPRAGIDSLCDEIIREPIEEIRMEIFDRLDTNDILFIDNSHRVFMNSDATTIFLDVIPRLKPGVLVEVHDVTLPYDYPSDWVDRYYSEQYLLAAYILAKGTRFDIVLPNYFISYDNELRRILSPLWEREEMKNVETHGCSFWMRMK
jgi:hypothetical protein